MKKTALILAMMLAVCSFASCGEKNNSDQEPEKNTPVSDEQNDTESETSEEETAPEETPAENEDDSIDDFEPEEFSRGKVNGNVYTTEFGRIKFTVPDGWSFLPDEELFNMMGFTPDNPDDEASVTQQILSQTTIYDAFAVNMNTGENISIMYDNLAALDSSYSSMTAEEYIDATQEQLAKIPGITYDNFSEKQTVRIGRKEFVKVTTSAAYDAGYSTDITYYARRTGDFIMMLVFSSAIGGGDMSHYESFFEALS